MKTTKTEIRKAINNEDIKSINTFCRKTQCSPYQLIKTTKAQQIHKTNLLIKYGLKNRKKDYSIYSEELHDFIQRGKIIKEMMWQIKRGYSNYTKLPNLITCLRPYNETIILMFCSPVYGLKDYNKFEIKINVYNNLEFCEKICKIGDQWLNSKTNQHE